MHNLTLRVGVQGIPGREPAVPTAPGWGKGKDL